MGEQHHGRCDGLDCKRCEAVRLRKLGEAQEPPSGESWVDYATSHQHVGTLCWQCVARKKALQEHAQLRADLDEQCRLHGKGAEREAALRADLAEALRARHKEKS